MRVKYAVGLAAYGPAYAGDRDHETVTYRARRAILFDTYSQAASETTHWPRADEPWVCPMEVTFAGWAPCP